MSPWAVATNLLGGRLDNGVEISPKYIGKPSIIQIAVATLATDRPLLLGVPGTAKSVGSRSTWQRPSAATRPCSVLSWAAEPTSIARSATASNW